MKALMYTGIGNLEIQQIKRPDGPYLVRVGGCGICGTDVKTFTVGHHFFKPPTILGHEFVGVLEKVPKGSSFVVGESVVVAPYFECGTCTSCKTNLPQLCTEKHYVSSGAFCEHVALPEDYEAGIIRIPTEDGGLVFTLVEPLACVLNGIDQLRLHKWSKALVVGGGPMGVLFGLYFQDIGIPVTVVEPTEYRRTLIKGWGIECVHPDEADPGLFDQVIISVNRSDLIADAVRKVANGGTVLVFSGLKREETFEADAYSIHYRQVTVTGCSGYALSHFRLAHSMIEANQTHYAKLITHKFTLEEGLDAFTLLTEGRAFKIVLTP